MMMLASTVMVMEAPLPTLTTSSIQSGLENGLLLLMSVPSGLEDSTITTLHMPSIASGLTAHTLTSLMHPSPLTSTELLRCLDHTDRTLFPLSRMESALRIPTTSPTMMLILLGNVCSIFSMPTLLDTSCGLQETSSRRDGTTLPPTTMAGSRTLQTPRVPTSHSLSESLSIEICFNSSMRQVKFLFHKLRYLLCY